MKRIVLVSWMAVLLAATGCGSPDDVAMFGNGGVRTNKYFGDLKIAGRGQTVNVLPDSVVETMKIAGDNNTVDVADGAVMSRLEIWGKDNTITVPEDLLFGFAEVGTNTVIRRPRIGGQYRDPGPMGELPGVPGPVEPRRVIVEQPKAPPPPPPPPPKEILEEPEEEPPLK